MCNIWAMARTWLWWGCCSQRETVPASNPFAVRTDDKWDMTSIIILFLQGENLDTARSLCQWAGSEQCSCYPGCLGHFLGDASSGDVETQIWPFSTKAHSRVSWLEVRARQQSPELFLQWGICAESSKNPLRRNELPAKYRLFRFEGHHPIYLSSQSFSNFYCILMPIFKITMQTKKTAGMRSLLLTHSVRQGMPFLFSEPLSAQTCHV